jgi:hypothetical protein
MNGMVLTGHSLSQFSDGQMIRVEGSLNTAQLSVTGATAVGTNLRVPQSGGVELEGFVTALITSTRYALGSITVDVSQASVFPANQSVTINALVEVYGVVQNGILLATKMEIKTETELSKVDITATIDSFVDLSDFTIRGQQCDASQARILSGSIGDLHQGQKIRVLGTSGGEESLIVTDLYAKVP